MKHLLLILFSAFTCFTVFAQETKSKLVVDPRIYEFYPASKVKTLLETEPEMIVFWNAIYKYGYQIVSSNKIKNKNLSEFPEVIIEDMENINVMALNIYPNKEIQYFRIKGSEKILLLETEQKIKNKIK